MQEKALKKLASHGYMRASCGKNSGSYAKTSNSAKTFSVFPMPK